MTHDHCQTCGERAWRTAPVLDAKDQPTEDVVYAYNCTSEVVVKKDSSVRVVKPCPNWEKMSPGAPAGRT